MPDASLRGTTDADAAKARGDLPTIGTGSEPDYLAAEADKIESFKQALFAAFLASPKTGNPTALVDLAAIYTGTLRPQMSLRGISATSPRTVKAAPFAYKNI